MIVAFNSYSSAFVGRLRKRSKAKHVWCLTIAGEPCTVVLFDSILRGKARVSLNGQEARSGPCTEFEKRFGLHFPRRNCTISLRKTSSDGYDLIINSTLFVPYCSVQVPALASEPEATPQPEAHGPGSRCAQPCLAALGLPAPRADSAAALRLLKSRG